MTDDTQAIGLWATGTYEALLEDMRAAKERFAPRLKREVLGGLVVVGKHRLLLAFPARGKDSEVGDPPWRAALEAGVRGGQKGRQIVLRSVLQGLTYSKEMGQRWLTQSRFMCM
jgi:hypothetical protein